MMKVKQPSDKEKVVAALRKTAALYVITNDAHDAAQKLHRAINDEFQDIQQSYRESDAAIIEMMKTVQRQRDTMWKRMKRHHIRSIVIDGLRFSTNPHSQFITKVRIK